MKTVFTFLLSLFAAVTFSQTFNFVIQPSSLNFTSSVQSMTTEAVVFSPQAGANSYSWSVAGPLSSTCATASNGSLNSLITVHCCGFQYTVTGRAYSMSTLLNTVSKTFQTTCPFATGIHETANAGLFVFPNPVNEYLQIDAETAGKVRLETYDGRALLEVSLSAGETRLQTQTIPAGIYMLSYVSESGTHSRRRIVVVH